MPGSTLNVGFNTPFAEQLAFFRQKLKLPSERWDDIQRSAHDRAFIVAGAADSDLLNDLFGAMNKAMAGGGGLEAFRKDFQEVVRKNGWTGWTGEGSKGGEAWRTRVIYQTNMATSYAAGRWRQLNDPALRSIRPYWRYIHSDGVMHPRPLHLAWHGLTLRHDHPFWKTHFPPNGWGCHCRITAVDADQYEKSKGAALTEPPAGWDEISPKTGAPLGLDKGFDYAPGASMETPLRQMVQDKLITYPPAITKALTKEVNRYINAHQGADDFVREVLADRQREDPLWVGFVEPFDALGSLAAQDLKGYLVLIPADAPRHIARGHDHDGHGQRAVRPEDYNVVPAVLNGYDEARMGTVTDNGLPTIVVRKAIGEEVFRAVFEVRGGKRNRGLALKSLVIKT